MKQFTKALAERDFEEAERVGEELDAQGRALAFKAARFALSLFPFVALVTISLLMYANWAVKDKKGKRKHVAVLIYIALVHVLLAIGKLMAFFLFLIPGFYVYVKLLFVSLIMLEEKKGALEAIKASWTMTRGNFWRLFLLTAINTILQIIAAPTIIGLVPVTGFANTARAAAFRMLWEGEQRDEGSYYAEAASKDK